MNDILLAYPIPTTDSPVKLTALSILFPGALFEKQGLKVAYFDERFDNNLDALIRDSREIGVSAFTGHQAGRAADILIRAKKINPKIITGVGGKYAQILPEEVLAEPFVDKVWSKEVYGEDLFPYNERTKQLFQQSDMQYLTSRGCPYHCTFCTLSSPWRPRDIQRLDTELKTIHNDIGFKTISFSDPNIACGNIDRIVQIGNILRDIDVKWDGNIRADYITPEMVDALVESNCYSLEFGCESGNDYFLRKVIKKGEGVDEIKSAVKNIRNSGISVMYSFMANIPKETRLMLLDTLDLIDWIVETDPDARVSIYNYAPYPGTKMYEDANFTPPTTMKGWGELKLMASPLYWIAGLCFRKDNTRKNFKDDWGLIEPYIKQAERQWKTREIDDFPCEEVERLIERKKNESIGGLCSS